MLQTKQAHILRLWLLLIIKSLFTALFLQHQLISISAMALKEIVIEERDPEEVTYVTGFSDGRIRSVRICPEDTIAANYGFDVTPARLVTGLITEKGICRATEKDIKEMFSE